MFGAWRVVFGLRCSVLVVVCWLFVVCWFAVLLFVVCCLFFGAGGLFLFVVCCSVGCLSFDV